MGFLKKKATCTRRRQEEPNHFWNITNREERWDRDSDVNTQREKMHSYSWRFEAPLTRKYQKKQRFAEEWQKNVSNCGMLGWWGATPNTLQQKQHYRLKIAYLIKQKKYWHLSWLHLNNNYLCIFERNSNTEHYSQPERIRSSLLISVPHSIHCIRCISFTASCWFFSSFF